MKLSLHRTALLLGGLLAAVLVFGQGNAPPIAQDPDEIIKFLSKIAAWHRQLTVDQPIAQVSDLTAVQENRRVRRPGCATGVRICP